MISAARVRSRAAVMLCFAPVCRCHTQADVILIAPYCAMKVCGAGWVLRCDAAPMHGRAGMCTGMQQFSVVQPRSRALKTGNGNRSAAEVCIRYSVSCQFCNRAARRSEPVAMLVRAEDVASGVYPWISRVRSSSLLTHHAPWHRVLRSVHSELIDKQRRSVRQRSTAHAQRRWLGATRQHVETCVLRRSQ